MQWGLKTESQAALDKLSETHRDIDRRCPVHTRDEGVKTGLRVLEKVRRRERGEDNEKTRSAEGGLKKKYLEGT